MDTDGVGEATRLKDAAGVRQLIAAHHLTCCDCRLTIGESIATQCRCMGLPGVMS